jgi:hypothetical protein
MLRDLKLRRLLGGNTEEEDEGADISNSKVPGNKLDEMRGLYETEGPALSEYKKHVTSTPQRGDYGNSTGRKLLAGVVGAMQAFGSKDPRGGIETTTGILDSRYKNALTDHAIRGKGLESAAGLEEQSRGNKIKYLLDSSNMERQDRNTNSLVQSRQAKAETDAGNAVSLRDYRDRQAGTAARNADINDRRAGIYDRSVDVNERLGSRRASAAERQADAAMMNANTGVNRERRMKDAPPKVKGPSAFQAKDAEDKALLDAMQEYPEGGEFITQNENTGKMILTPPTGDPEAMEKFINFRKVWERRKKARLGQNDINLPELDDPDDDEDYEVIEE